MRNRLKNMIENRLTNSVYYAIPILLALTLACPRKTAAQKREYLLKAGYIEKFTHFIEWPADTNINDSTAEFPIAVIGENKFGDAIEKIFSKVKIKNKKVRIAYISSVDEIDKCMILIISESKRKELEDILNYIIGKPILTIGESRGYGKMGVIINMFVDKNYIRYEINRATLERSGLKISSLLMASAVLVGKNE